MSELTREQVERMRAAFCCFSEDDEQRRRLDTLCNMAISALDVRERCAQVCDETGHDVGFECAREIRALNLGAQDQTEKP